MDEPTSFGYWVRRRRKALDLTQGELARQVGCAQVTIQKIEADERRPSRQIADLLAEHLQIAPAERATFLQLARGEFAAAASPAIAAPAPPVPTAAPRHNLPMQLTSFIGRASELAATVELLAAHRLLTLTGPGGTGKTRLALQAAAMLLERFPDGVWLAELAPLPDAALIVQAIATHLGLREEPGQTLLATLIRYLHNRQLLLVIDDCEHLIDACAQLSEILLHSAAELRILATSREPLGIMGEAVLRVPPLAAPDPYQVPPHDQLAQYEAVQLFDARARAAQPDFQITDANAAQIAQICARLDGIPLAIELAAARMRVLTIEQICARLDDRFQLLVEGSRSALPRHQTLHALIDWSYDLLSEAERALLRRLAVFVGGCTLDAAEEVCFEPVSEHNGSAIGPFLILDELAHLVDKSLVQAEQAGGAARYRLLETIRQYALEKLAASGEARVLRRRHAQYFLDRALLCANKADRIAWITTEHDNLRAALAWSQTAPDGAEIGMRLVLELGDYWALRGHWTEARRWVKGTLQHPEALERTPLRARLVQNLGSIQANLNEYAAARAAYDESRQIYQELGDLSGQAWVLNRLGWLAREQGDTATAQVFLEQSLALGRQIDDRDCVIAGLNTLAEVAVMQGNAAQALALLDQSLALARSDGDTNAEAWALNHLGHVAQLQGDFTRAAQLHQESLALFRAMGEQHLGTAWALHSLGESTLAQGDLASARQWLAAALAQFRNLDDRAGVSWCLRGLGSLAALGMQPERAVRLWGAAEQLRAALGCRPAPAGQASYQRAQALARERLGAPAFEAAWAEGQALAFEQAVAYAVETM